LFPAILALLAQSVQIVLLEYTLALACVASVLLGAPVRELRERALSPRITSDDVISGARTDIQEDARYRYIMAESIHEFEYVASTS
jgi:hypothetical protein